MNAISDENLKTDNFENWFYQYYRVTPAQMVLTPLTLTEEQTLFTTFFAGRDKDHPKDHSKLSADALVARDKIIRNHIVYAAVEARKIASDRFSYEDIISAANWAIMKALDGFDLSKGYRFTSYLRLFIKGEVNQLWRTKCPLNVPAGELCVGIEITGISNFRAELTVQHSFADERETRDRNSMLLEALNRLTEQERFVILKYYVDGLKFAAIARIMVPEIHRESVRKIHVKAINKLRVILKKKEIFN